VTCVPSKPKRGQVRVVCTVKLGRSAAREVRARLTRGGKTYARGVARKGRALKLEAVRRMPPASYRLTVVSVDSRGRATVSRSTVQIGA
jgi:hypothetical protein